VCHCFLLISGYGAFVGANKQNLHFAFLGGMSGFVATAMGAFTTEIDDQPL
jgi:ZIP family zinc transporter